MADADFFSKVVEAAREHERELGLPEGFFDALLEESDWSFIIKLHSLLEASLTQALVVHLDLEAARDVLANLEMSNSRTDKLAFSKALGFLESEDRRFIQSLSELRNDLVHDIRNVTFTFESHLVKSTATQRRVFARNLGYTELEEDGSAAELDKHMKRFVKNPKRLVWRSAIFVIAVLQLRMDTKRLQREAEKSQAKFAELVGSNFALQRTRDSSAALAVALR